MNEINPRIGKDYFSNLYDVFIDSNIINARKVDLIGKTLADIINDKKPSFARLNDKGVADLISCAFNCMLNLNYPMGALSDLRTLYDTL
jgi:hypothetical protein